MGWFLDWRKSTRNRSQHSSPNDMSQAFSLSVEKYHAMIRAGILSETDRCELIEGVLVEKSCRTPPHRFVTGWLLRWFHTRESNQWFSDAHEPITTLDSEPEPDLTVIRGRRADYAKRHPQPHQVLLLIEVAESTLAYDRTVKKRLYARAGIPIYWIVNLIDKQIEVHTLPSDSADRPDYAERRIVTAGEELEVVIGGQVVGRIAAQEPLPA